MPPKFILEKKTLSNQQKTSFNSWYNQKKQQILQTLLFTEEEKDNLSLFIDKISNWKEFDIPNLQQIKAITHDKGPIFVIAWPWTWKTSILTKRIAFLVNNWIPAEKILCLTFTNTGVSEMIERSKKYIDIIHPYKMGEINSYADIKTFHKFCIDILNEKIENCLISEQKEKEIIEELLLNYSWDYIFSTKDIKKQSDPIWSLIKKLKSKWISPYLLESLLFKNWNNIYEEDERIQKYTAFEFRKLYTLYNKTLKEKGLYWLDEVIDLILQEFQLENSELLKKIHNKYDYIMIDEYQDTSPNQNEVIKYISKLYNSNAIPNLFVVWDDDQSIFKFQGSDVENMQNLRDMLCIISWFKELTLEENYRSSQNILDVSSYSIKKNTNRLNPNKLLQSNKDIIAPVKINWFITDLDETSYIVNTIQNFLIQNPNKTIWILAITNNNLSKLEKELQLQNINYNKNWNCDIKWYKESWIIYNFLKFVLKINLTKTNYIESSEEFSLSIIDPFISKLNINLFDLFRNYKFTEKYRISLFDLIKITNLSLFKQIIFEKIEDIEFDSIIQWGEIKEKIKKTVIFKEEKTDKGLSPSSFIEKIYYIYWKNKKKMYDLSSEKFIIKSGLSEESLEKINNFIIFIKTIWDSFITTKSSINSFEKNFINLFEIFENKDKISLFQYYKNLFLESNISLESKNLKGFVEYIWKETLKPKDNDKLYPQKEKTNVVLTTVHSSKGKEYNKVILYKTQEKYWWISKDSDKILLKKELFKLHDQDYFNTDDIEERRRLFYVAMTRAKEDLEITYFQKYISWQNSCSSYFLQELIESTNHELKQKIQYNLENNRLNLYESDENPLENLIFSNLEYKEWIIDKLKKYRLSYSSLKKFKESPKKFFEEEILNLPKEEDSSSEQFWTIIHDILKDYFEFFKNNKWNKFEWEKLLYKKLKQTFYWNITNYQKRGEKLIKSYIITLNSQNNINFDKFEIEQQFLTEYYFDPTWFNDWINIKWFIDKIENIWNDKTSCNIYDYKISWTDFEVNEKKYIEQLHFYKLWIELKWLSVKQLFIDYLQYNWKNLYEKKEIKFNKDIENWIKADLINIKTNYFNKLYFPISYNI